MEGKIKMDLYNKPLTIFSQNIILELSPFMGKRSYYDRGTVEPSKPRSRRVS
jgi:hypothetical protein